MIVEQKPSAVWLFKNRDFGMLMLTNLATGEVYVPEESLQSYLKWVVDDALHRHQGNVVMSTASLASELKKPRPKIHFSRLVLHPDNLNYQRFHELRARLLRDYLGAKV